MYWWLHSENYGKIDLDSKNDEALDTDASNYGEIYQDINNHGATDLDTEKHAGIKLEARCYEEIYLGIKNYG